MLSIVVHCGVYNVGHCTKILLELCRYLHACFAQDLRPLVLIMNISWIEWFGSFCNNYVLISISCVISPKYSSNFISIYMYVLLKTLKPLFLIWNYKCFIKLSTSIHFVEIMHYNLQVLTVRVVCPKYIKEGKPLCSPVWEWQHRF